MKKQKSKSTTPAKELLPDVKNYAEFFRKLPEIQTTQVQVEGDEQLRKLPYRPTKLWLTNAGGSVRGAMRHGHFKEFQTLLSVAFDKGGEYLWIELVKTLRKRAKMSQTFDYLQTFAEDCQLVADVIQAEIEGIQWDKDPNCMTATDAKEKLKDDLGIIRSLPWFTDMSNEGHFRYKREGQRRKIYWPDVKAYIEKKDLKKSRFLKDATRKAGEKLLANIFKT